jgi:hypothetical protein
MSWCHALITWSLVFKLSLNLGKIYKNTFSSQSLANKYKIIDSKFITYIIIVYYAFLLFCGFDKNKD